MVPGDQYRYALTNFVRRTASFANTSNAHLRCLHRQRIAHEQVEQQRKQMEEQERQVALLRARIAALEGGGNAAPGQKPAGFNKSGSTIDDFTIKVRYILSPPSPAVSHPRDAECCLETRAFDQPMGGRYTLHHVPCYPPSLISYTDVTRTPPAPMNDIRDAALWDIHDGEDIPRDPNPASAMEVQNLLRHALSKAISDGIINCLIVTDSTEANVQLTRIHEHIFARTHKLPGFRRLPILTTILTGHRPGDPTVACVWRRQTFTAAIDSPSAEMTEAILTDFVPGLSKVLQPSKEGPSSSQHQVVRTAYEFSRMLHGAPGGAGAGADAFYRAFVPERHAPLDPHQMELVRRCARSERGEGERVGASVFPGLVKVTNARVGAQTTVRRAQVICECALMAVTAAPTIVHSDGV